MIARAAIISAIACGVAGVVVLLVPTDRVAFLELVGFKQLIFGFLLVATACLLANVWYTWRLEFPIRLFAGLMTTCTGLGVGLAAVRRLVPRIARVEDTDGGPRVLHVEFDQFDWVTMIGMGFCLFFAVFSAAAAGVFFYIYHRPTAK